MNYNSHLGATEDRQFERERDIERSKDMDEGMCEECLRINGTHDKSCSAYDPVDDEYSETLHEG